MVELHPSDTLRFEFPEIHPDAVLNVCLKRTFRVDEAFPPDELPIAPETLPMEHVSDYADKVFPNWLRHGGVMLGLYQSEAMCLEFHSPNGFPFAVKVGTGKRCAITGEAWVKGLMTGERIVRNEVINLQNYVVVPPQRRLDGYKTDQGKVRQFIAVGLGQGATVEEQLTGSAEVGGLQIQIFPLSRKALKLDQHKPEKNEELLQQRSNFSIESKVLHYRSTVKAKPLPVFEKERPEPATKSVVESLKHTASAWWGTRSGRVRQEREEKVESKHDIGIRHCMSIPIHSKPISETKIEEKEPCEEFAFYSDDDNSPFFLVLERKQLFAGTRPKQAEMGLAAGAEIKQLVFKDHYELEDWDCHHTSRVFVHLLDANYWQQVTGKRLTRRPFDQNAYSTFGLSWSPNYADAESVVGSRVLADVKPLSEVRRVEEGE